MDSFVSILAMVIVQLSSGAGAILIQIGLAKGLNQFVLMVYMHVIATIALAPLAYFLERKQCSPISPSLLVKIFLLTALGITIHHNLNYCGLTYTSATVDSALSNVVPSFTFLMAFLLRLETVKFRSRSGQAKVVGTIICICGSLMFTLWKGGFLYKSFGQKPLINYIGEHQPVVKQNWIKGSAMILTGNIIWSLWLILQAIVCKDCLAPLSLNTLICFFASIQSSVVASVLARDPADWNLDWNVELLTILYAGIGLGVLVFNLQIWCISKNGPVFTSMFNPLRIVMVGIFSAIAFAERLHVGSLVGSILSIVGLYCYLWGRRKEDIITTSTTDEQSQEEKSSLFDDKRHEFSINVSTINLAAATENK